MTAVELLQEQYYESEGKLTKQDFEQAKEIEEQHIIDSFTQGDSFNWRNGKQYYEQTFNK